jgi:hypothetical protein
MVNQVFSFCELLQVAGPSNSTLEQRGDRHCDSVLAVPLFLYAIALRSI